MHGNTGAVTLKTTIFIYRPFILPDLMIYIMLYVSRYQ